MLANRLQAKQKELEQALAEIRELKEKTDAMEGHAKLQKRLLDKTNQPYSYMIKDVEKAEKELFNAQKKIKQQEELLMKIKKENEGLKI